MRILSNVLPLVLLLVLGITGQRGGAQAYEYAFETLSPVTKDKLEMMEKAAHWAEKVYTNHTKHNLVCSELSSEGATRYEAKRDAVFVAEDKKHHYCYMAFMGTVNEAADAFRDWIPNLKPGYQEVSSLEAESKSCSGAIGWMEALGELHEATCDGKTFVQGVEDCMKNEENRLIITGHSQGAAIATLAAVQFEAYKPVMVGWATPASLEDECSWLDADKFWRVTNTMIDSSYKNNLIYDAVAYTSRLYNLRGTLKKLGLVSGGGMGVDVGDMVLLPAEDPDTWAANETVKLNPTNTPWATAYGKTSAGTVHSVKTYKAKIKKLLKNDAFPIGTKGFLNFRACDFNKDCLSGRCDVVDESEEEKSNLPYVEHECKPTLTHDDLCTENSDCETNYCALFLSTPVCYDDPSKEKFPNGYKCGKNHHCKSDRCTAYDNGEYMCEAKLEPGSHCHFHKDCESNKCNWSFECEPPAR